jgi:hypothetical protein
MMQGVTPPMTKPPLAVDNCPRCDVERGDCKPQRATLAAGHCQRGSTILLINPFLRKAFPMRAAADARSLLLILLFAKKPGITESLHTIRWNNHICGGVYGSNKSGDGPMNLPVELQRRFDQRWAARFGGGPNEVPVA